MRNHTEERIFTKKGLAIGLLLYSIYGVILFSIDPEWVGWAGPMIFGALYVPNSPPPLFPDPKAAIQTASLFSLLSLAVLLLLMPMVGEVRFGWLSWLKARVRNGGLRGGANPANSQGSEREVLSWTLISAARNGNMNASAQTCDLAAVGQERGTVLPHSRRAVSQNVECGTPEDIESLRGEAICSGNIDLLRERSQ